jgi:hypothetical protein
MYFCRNWHKKQFLCVVVRILRARVNRSVWRPAAARVLLSFMEVISPVAWREANKCLETKEEFDLNTRGSPLKAGHWLLHYACSLPCLRPRVSTATWNRVQHPSSLKIMSCQKVDVTCYLIYLFSYELFNGAFSSWAIYSIEWLAGE